MPLPLPSLLWSRSNAHTPPGLYVSGCGLITAILSPPFALQCVCIYVCVWVKLSSCYYHKAPQSLHDCRYSPKPLSSVLSIPTCLCVSMPYSPLSHPP